MKLRKYEGRNGESGFTFYCPGCKHHHAFPNGSHWSFNGDLGNPTFDPSLLNTFPGGEICHLHVKEGKIDFAADCTHELAGKTVEMEDVE